MAQMGSFVPAREAKVGLVDRIFTRVGARDQILRGQSTFMVEMQETAHILRHATRAQPGAARRDRPRHRHLRRALDRLGGGRAPARSGRRRPKTLFATHYHELTDLAADLPGVGNLHVSAREWQDSVVFLRKIEPGGSDRSFGIQVARLAGLPARRRGARPGDPGQPRAHRVRPRGPPVSPIRTRAATPASGSSRSSPDRTKRSSTSCAGPIPTSSPRSRHWPCWRSSEEAVLTTAALRLLKIHPRKGRTARLLPPSLSWDSVPRPPFYLCFRLELASMPLRGSAAGAAEPAGAHEPPVRGDLKRERPRSAGRLTDWTPLADVYETSEAYLVDARARRASAGKT